MPTRSNIDAPVLKFTSFDINKNVVQVCHHKNKVLSIINTRPRLNSCQKVFFEKLVGAVKASTGATPKSLLSLFFRSGKTLDTVQITRPTIKIKAIEKIIPSVDMARLYLVLTR